MPERDPDVGVLLFIRGKNPIAWEELLGLWQRVQNYEALETIVDIAIREHMPLWAAEESFKESWLAYRQANW